MASWGHRAQAWHRWAHGSPCPSNDASSGGTPKEAGLGLLQTRVETPPLPGTTHSAGASWQPQPRPGARPCPAPVVIGGGRVGQAWGAGSQHRWSSLQAASLPQENNQPGQQALLISCLFSIPPLSPEARVLRAAFCPGSGLEALAFF